MPPEDAPAGDPESPPLGDKPSAAEDVAALPPVAPSPLYLIPEHLLLAVLAFHDAATLLSVCKTSRYLNTVASSQNLWRRLLVLDFFLFATRVPDINNAKFEFQQLYGRAMVARKHRHLKRERGRLLLRSARLRGPFLKVIKCLSVQRFLLPMVSFCSLAFVCLITAALYSPFSIWVVFVPVWMVSTHIAFSIVVEFILHWNRNNPQSVLHGLWEHMQLNELSKGILAEIIEDRPNGEAVFTKFYQLCAILAGLFAFAVLICLRLSSFPSLPWTVVFVPLWFSILMLFAAQEPPVVVRNLRLKLDDWRAVLFFCFLASLTIILALYLQQVIVTSLAAAFAPLWVFDAYIVLGICVEAYFEIKAEEEIFQTTTLVWIVVFLFLCPLLVWQVLLCVYVNSLANISPGATFSPLILWLGLVTLSVVVSAWADDPAERPLPLPPPRLPGATRDIETIDDFELFALEQNANPAPNRNIVPEWEQPVHDVGMVALV